MNGVAKRSVAIGGGTGLPLVLRCLSGLGHDVTAIVTVADDGGSSGALRRQLGILPPGDIRNCLVALADEDSELGRVFQYRFEAGDGLTGHALGNLIIAALTDIKGGFAQAVESASELLGTHGAVVPSTVEDVVLQAVDASGNVVTGQAKVARSEGPIIAVTLSPDSPMAHPPAIEAILEADMVVIGPGSLFTSIIPNVLVNGIAEALRSTTAKVVYVCNVANQRGETTGMDAAAHVEALEEHGLRDVIDIVMMHDTGDASRQSESPLVCGSPEVRGRIAARGIEVRAGVLVNPDEPLHHDRSRLCAMLSEVL